MIFIGNIALQVGSYSDGSVIARPEELLFHKDNLPPLQQHRQPESCTFSRSNLKHQRQLLFLALMLFPRADIISRPTLGFTSVYTSSDIMCEGETPLFKTV